MLLSVFFDVRYFMGVYAIIVCMFSIIYFVLFSMELPETYIGVSNFGFILDAIQLSLGNYDVEGYSALPQELLITIWVVWMLSVFMLNIIFMNFIIAVISESYERVTSTQEAVYYQTLADFIYERELRLTSNSKKNFPEFLILRRVAETQVADDSMEVFARDIKKAVKNTTNSISV